MVHVLIDLFRLSVLAEQAAEHTLASKPKDLLRHAALFRTSPLARTTVTALSFGGQVEPLARARMNFHWLADDEAVLYKLANVLACAAEPAATMVLRACAGRESQHQLLPSCDDKWDINRGWRPRTGICHGNLIDLRRIQPNLAFAAAQDGCSQPLLQLQGHLYARCVR